MGFLKLGKFLQRRVDARDVREERHVDFKARRIVHLRDETYVGYSYTVSNTILPCAM